MPLYDYECTKCHKITEVRRGFDERHTEPCPYCGGELKRLFNPAGIVFKGSGFYVTDSRKATESKAASKPAESKSGETKSAESKSADSKSESKSESKPSGGSKESAA
ncbi:MAG: FmdB family transcriptional regulator [Candidatus Eremiobacteraeota bacterium]|nr:FmdB family transcriptional regulator [Candidatus Eremiobacteraeota bacterium]